jgi:hypothetical protein
MCRLLSGNQPFVRTVKKKASELDWVAIIDKLHLGKKAGLHKHIIKTGHLE